MSLRRRVRKALFDFYCPYFLREVIVKFMIKAKGHFVTLVESGLHVIKCISAHLLSLAQCKSTFNVPFSFVKG